ncbi:MAG: hypothetical protein U0S50_04370 [Sphingopyxis sp.]|uniref:SRPBCC family protein n=1 Tax=Sphingopyxis sp. TaxID=1908224 RepID=UPI002AB8E219|nr:hypothetical protein [Sphingopyxis sp.]MDZ3831035.1 hypothetical protein [Sphingopyxis sp.]
MSDRQEMPRRDRVLVDVTIAAPADLLWDAIRDPAAIKNWFGWDSETLGEEIRYIFVDHARADADHRIIHFEGTDDRIEIVADGARSRLRIIRAVAAGDSWDGIYEDMTEGWISFAQQLRFGIERHALADRRTIRLSGAARNGAKLPIEALGLAPLRSLSPGTPLVIPGPATMGARGPQGTEGIAWHRGAWQVGLAVPAWGDGLLIVTDRPAQGETTGGGSATLTTYGLDADRFEALETRWRQWWQEHFAAPPTDPESCERA